jgi:tRNA threonylcarbamoyladenosine biosynthesis protein TsaE
MSAVGPGPVPLDTPLELREPADTEALGERLAADLRAGDLLVLSGPLGAGKTVLVRGLARGLGVGGPVTSPTFVIAREHRPLAGGAGVPLVHVDAYRLGVAGGSGGASGAAAGGSDPVRPPGPHDPADTGARIAAELDDLDLDTDLTGAVVAVEWGEGVAERLSARHVVVRLDRRPDDVRVAHVHRAAPEPPARAST